MTGGWHLRERARLSGGAVAWERFGRGEPVVLVHGTPSWSYLWRGVVPTLAERFAVYLLDLLGYGDSERRDDQDLSIAAQARLLAELLERWQLESPRLVGHDIGGAIALRTTLCEGRALSGLALVDAAVFNPWNTPTTRHIKAHLDAYRTMPAHVYEAIVSAHLRTAVHRGLDADTLAAYLEPWRGEAGQAAYFRKIAQWRDEDTGVLEPLLETVSVPTLVLWGERDAWLEPAVGERLARSIPGAELRLVPEAGHFAPEDAPEAVSRALLEFFGH